MAGRASKRKAEKPTARKPSNSSTREVDAAQGRRAGTSAYTVFISYDSVELWIATQMKKEIEALGARTWLDRKDMRGGDEIIEGIHRGLGSCQEALVLLSTHSATSQWVLYEIGAADAHGRHITPILNNMAPGAIAPLAGRRTLDLNEFDAFLLELAERMKAAREEVADDRVKP